MPTHSRLSIAIGIILLINLDLPAQQIEWIKFFDDSPGESQARDITTDEAGNVYAVGHFSDQVDFDPGAGEANLTALGQTDIYLVKLDPEGDLLWVKQVGGGGLDQAQKVELDKSGNIFLSGLAAAGTDLDPGANVITSNGGIFLSKFNNDGDLVWSYHLDGGAIPSFFVAPDSSIYMTGSFANTIDFDNGAGRNELTAMGPSDVFLLKLNEKGQHIWGVSMGGNLFDAGQAVLADETGVYLSFTFFTEMDADPGPGEFVLPHGPPGFDAAVAKFDVDGGFLWAEAYGTPAADRATVQFGADDQIFISVLGDVLEYSLDGTLIDTFIHPLGGLPTLDNRGKVIRAGSWIGRRDFDPGPDSLVRTSALDLSGSSNFDLFAMRFDLNLVPEWLVTVSSTEQLLYRGGSTATPDALYFQSEHFSELTIDDGGDTTFYSGKGSNSTFIVKLRTCSPTLTSLEVVSCGSYNFGDAVLTMSGNYRDTLQGREGCDSIVLLNLTISSPITESLEVTACESFTFGNQELTISGLYTDTLQNATGCDSIVELNLVIDSLTSDVMVTDSNIVVLSSESTYQWFVCGDDLQIIEEATSATLTPIAGGQYAVEIRSGSCRDTSECFDFSLTSSADNIFDLLKVTPNPTADILRLNLNSDPIKELEIVQASTGQQVQSSILSNASLDVSGLVPGLYMIRLRTARSKYLGKFVKL